MNVKFMICSMILMIMLDIGRLLISSFFVVLTKCQESGRVRTVDRRYFAMQQC